MRDKREKNIKKEQPVKKSNVKELPEDLKKMLDEVEKEEKKKKK
jgi:hypothetical protein